MPNFSPPLEKDSTFRNETCRMVHFLLGLLGRVRQHVCAFCCACCFFLSRSQTHIDVFDFMSLSIAAMLQTSTHLLHTGKLEMCRFFSYGILYIQPRLREKLGKFLDENLNMQKTYCLHNGHVPHAFIKCSTSKSCKYFSHLPKCRHVQQ